jgi:hypothetical protein
MSDCKKCDICGHVLGPKDKYLSTQVRPGIVGDIDSWENRCIGLDFCDYKCLQRWAADKDAKSSGKKEIENE